MQRRFLQPEACECQGQEHEVLYSRHWLESSCILITNVHPSHVMCAVLVKLQVYVVSRVCTCRSRRRSIWSVNSENAKAICPVMKVHRNTPTPYDLTAGSCHGMNNGTALHSMSGVFTSRLYSPCMRRGSNTWRSIVLKGLWSTKAERGKGVSCSHR